MVHHCKIILPLLIIFLWLNFISTQDGGHNAMSRFATLHALTQDHTLNIDKYVDYTVDWAKSKSNGHSYSNKAPGAVFLALPVYFVVDGAERFFRAVVYKNEPYPLPGYFRKTLTSYLVQVIPFTLLAIVGWNLLLEMGTPLAGAFFFLLAFLFGNTSAILMNSFFGHGLAAMLFFSGILALQRKDFGFVGFFLGFAALTDYGGVPLSLIFIAGYFWGLHREHPERFFPLLPRHCLRLILGALLPATLWISYHTLAFGSPFALPMSQLSPVFIEAKHAESALWGVIGLIPDPKILYEILLGNHRGILVSQPWILLAVVLLPALSSRNRIHVPLVVCTSLSFLLLLYMNTSFEGWHGGAAPGPRYLSMIFPLYAYLVAIYWKFIPPSVQRLLWITLGIALIFRLLVSTGSILCPQEENLWGYFWRGITQVRRGSELGKLLAIGLVSLILGAFSYRNLRSTGQLR